MWGTIAKAIPWETVFSGVVWIILKIIGKSEEKKELKEKFLKFIAEVDKDKPIKIHQAYRQQIEELRKQVLGEEESLRQLKASEKNYKENFKKLYSENLRLENEILSIKGSKKV